MTWIILALAVLAAGAVLSLVAARLGRAGLAFGLAAAATAGAA